MIIRFFNGINSFLLIVIFTLVAPQINGQTLSGTKTVCSSGCDYPTISSAVNALNTNGVGTGGVTINVLAGHTETLTSGMVLSVSGTSTNPIVFQKNGTGSNPLITSFSGNKLAGSTDSIDVMWSFEGSDYVTVNGIDFQENVLNTTPTSMMEVAIGFYKKSGTDGANHNEIKNCVITLNRNNFTLSSGVRSNASGAVGIEFVNATRTNLGTSIAVSSVSGASSFNKIYGNTIQNCNFGVSLIGYAAPSPYAFADINNEIGGETSLTGNTIINFGGGAGANTACGAMFIHNQWGFLIANNTVNNNTGAGQNHPNSNRGIWVFATPLPSSCNIKKNKVTISGGSSTNSINWAIGLESTSSGGNGSNVVNIDSNQFLNCNVTTNSSANFAAIWLNTLTYSVNVRSNVIYGFRYSGTGVSGCILSNRNPSNVNISNNLIDSVLLDGISAEGTHYCIGLVLGTLENLSINNNTIKKIVLNTPGAGVKTIYGIYSRNSTILDGGSIYLAGNIIDSIVRNGTTGGSTFGIVMEDGDLVFIRENSVSNLYINGSGTSSSLVGIRVSGAPFVIQNNNVFNISCQKNTGNSALIGISVISDPPTINEIESLCNNNSVYNLSNSGTFSTTGINYFYRGNARIYDNVVNSISGNGTLVAGFLVTCNLTHIYRNKTYDILSNSSGNPRVFGISLSVLSDRPIVYNNLIGDLKAPYATTASPLTQPTISGIHLQSSTGNSSVDLLHNTIFINASSTGTVFATAAIFHPSSTGKLTLRNNILVNKSSPSGAGRTVVYQKSSSSLNVFDTSSNNNLFYAGTPSTNRLIYFDGVSGRQTLNDYKNWVAPRDSASFTEDVLFLNTIGASPSFLRINPSVATLVEGGGRSTPITKLDFANTIRAGFDGYTGSSGSPDIGAWEDELTPNMINNMYLNSLKAEHVVAVAPQGASNAVILRIPIYTSKGTAGLIASAMKLNTSGTTNTNDINKASIYYTGASPTFDSNNLFGTINQPSGLFTITGSQLLISGVNYFWLVYDVSTSATPNNLLDAVLDSITLSGISYVPLVSSPNGACSIQPRLSGRYNVGSGFTFSTLTQAISALYQLGVGGPVTFVLKNTTYDSGTGEIFPIVLSDYPNASLINKVTIVPDSNVAVTISGNSNTATIDFNGASHFCIDGRKGGIGGFVSGSNLIINTTSTVAPAVRFVNDADSNQILYTDLRSSNTNSLFSVNAGVVNFGTTTKLNGNDFNTIKFCDIREANIGLPVTAISSIGSAISLGSSNDNNIIDSCNIYNFFSSTKNSSGIYLGQNNNEWLIRGNKFFQTGVRTTSMVDLVHRIIWIRPNVGYTTGYLRSANGIVIQNNFVGGNNSLGSGLYTLVSNYAHQFYVFDLHAGGELPLTVEGNIITNINYTGFNLSLPVFIGVQVSGYNSPITATIKGNIIGSRTQNGALTIMNPRSEVIGISAGDLTGDILDNVISGVDLNGANSALSPSFIGITIHDYRSINVLNNLIGDTTSLSGSIRVFSVATGGTYVQSVTGIYITRNIGTHLCTISNNAISNIFNYHSVSGTQVNSTKGIFCFNNTLQYGGTFIITNNLISNIYSSAKTTLGGSNPAIGGIVINGVDGTLNLSQNKIKGLFLTGNTYSTLHSTGIFFSTNNGSNHTLSRNEVHTQMVQTNNPLAVIKGIELESGINTVTNNIVRMGIDSLGNSINYGLRFQGITKNEGNSKIYFNTIYIGGNNVSSSTSNSAAFLRTGVGIDDVRNNIFNNVRSNISSGLGHYAIQLNHKDELTLDNNLLFADTVGRIGVNTYARIDQWKIGLELDGNSIYGNPGFVNPNGGINTVDLRINPSNPTPIEGTGAVVTGDGTDIDFDGQLRAANTPVDIGADAGVFTLLDLAPPIINYTKLLNTTSVTDRVIIATITDKTGIYTSDTLRPRVYFKKSASGIFQSTSGVLTSGNGQNGSWTFTINNALLGGVTGSDSIYYFIVAQDSVASSNLGSNPGGVNGTNVNNITFSPALNAYKITAIISGTFNVGIGQPFGSLTAVNGLFNHINTSIVGGNITVNITSDIEEPGTIALLNTTETGIGNYNILIQPNAPVIYSITGAVGNAGSGLIRLVGAKRVTIDGRFSGTGRYLRFINRQQAGVTLLLYQEAQKDTIRNCIVEGVNNTFGIIQFGGSTVSDGIGNDSNAIIGCLIRDTLGTLATHNIANTSISCSGTIGRENDRIAILDNEMVNFGFNAINLTSSGTGNFWNISNNKIYQTITKNNLMQIVLVQGGSGHTIINNSIGGSAINRSGAAFRSTAGIIAIDITSAVGTNYPIMVSGNVISNLGVTGTTTGVSALRMAGGNLIISNNTIGGGMMPHDTIMNCYDGAIHIIGGASALVDNNLISHMNYYYASLNHNTGIHIVTSTASPLTVQRNTIQNISGNQTGTGTTSFRPAGITVTLAPVTGLTITQNTIRNIRNFNSSSGAYLASGIFYAGGASTTPIITQNRIRNIGAVGTGTGTSAPEVSGICILSATNAVVANNQISLGDSALNQSRVYGIFDGTGGSNTYAYNSIFINGHTSAGVNHSSGFHRSTTTSSINFRNNLIYNKRTTSGTGFAYAISSASSSNFAGANFNYNMFILNDTARLLELPSGTSIGWSAMNNLYPTYNTNWAERSSIVAPHAIFIDTLNGNLGIDSSSSAAWYVNGKGIRIQNLSGDFNHVTNVRSTEITSGATDIGSVEFTPTSMPPIAHADKAPAANDSTRFYFASKLVAKAVWGSSGTLPSVVNLRYYSGTNPVNTPTGSTFANAYYDLQALGGSGYNHNLTLMLDSAVMGSIASVNRTQIANYQGALSNWTRYTNTIPSGNNGYFKVFGLTNGGAFTFTDSAFNPLPVSLNYFTAKVSGNDVLLNWQTASEKNNRGFYLERSTDGKFFNEFDFVFGKGNSNILCNYSNTDINPFTNSSILYYRLKQVDFDGNYTYSKATMVRLDNKRLNAPIIYPNPVLADMYVELNSPTKANVSVQLIDIHGKEVYNQLIQVNDGINKILVPEIATLHAGVYLAKIVVDGEVYTMKVIKQ